ncbi:hypothetical protein [Mucilaginibacter agri]|uniref:Uncharacterized protein n=1 Tax=Mucilaginibacter agri TaxID=2695265 RepID=A0A965ZFN2_9SPHI|nr:hypothetical protein [Mucilaginibacter agri]NCD69134.1 hypothetical protein [Mucilaginibacter agri]
MKRLASSIIGGIAGTVALNILHQAVKKFDHDAPRVDLVGEEAMTKGLEKAGIAAPTGDKLFMITMAADLISNAAYYSMIGTGKRKQLPYIGAITGLVAGVGALTLTKPVGLNDEPVTRTVKTKILTVAWYTFGGLVAGSVIKVLRK